MVAAFRRRKQLSFPSGASPGALEMVFSSPPPKKCTEGGGSPNVPGVLKAFLHSFITLLTLNNVPKAPPDPPP